VLSRFSTLCLEVVAVWTTSITVAQQPYTLAGKVVASGGRGLANAEVVVVEPRSAERSLRSDSSGAFEATLQGPSAVLRVRSVGFEPRTVAVSITGDSHRSTVTIALDPTVKTLDTVAVSDSARDRDDIKLRDYNARKASNSFARFVDGEDIEKKKPRVVSEMLRSMAGITLQASTTIGNIVHIRGCAPLVWVDGVRMPGVQLDEAVAPDDVAAMEIYYSFSGLPSRYFDRTATCGTILVWLKS